MNRKLTAKAQQIKPTLPESGKSFSDILIVEPDNQTLLLKKGTVYCIFDIASATELNTQVVSKLVYDTLHDSYFQSENISPIQSLEKAISAVKERIGKMSSSEFNILTGALWGNVMYVVKYGKAGSVLMRAGETKNISANSEGNFSTASGVVKDEDVIMFATHEFSSQFPPEKLLTSAVQAETLPLNAACLILKFVVDTSFSDTEAIDFGIKPVNKPKKFMLLENLRKRKKDNETKTISDIKLKIPSKIKLSPVAIAIVAALLLVTSIGYSVTRNSSSNTTNSQEVVATEQSPNTEATLSVTTSNTPDEVPTITEGFDETTKTQRVTAEVLYDIKIAEATANPTQITVVDNTLVAADKTNGKLYTSSASVPKFTAEPGTFLQVGNLNNAGGNLNFTDTEGYKTYNLTSQQVTTSYAQPGLGVTWTYLDFIYAVSGDSIIKYTKTGTSLTPATWAQNSDFSGAKSMSIAISIYVLTENDTLVKYTSGVKDTYNLTGLTQPLSNSKQILTHLDWNNIYIADAGNKRIVILNKDGSLVKQILHTNESSWDDIRSISVTSDETKLFVLNGSRVYQVTL